MKLRKINERDFGLILKQDKRVYPASSPVTEEIISKWYENDPEFGMIYEENEKFIGDCIIIPLNAKWWTKLIKGKLSESETDEKTIFNNSRDNKIGIHIYHIEKIDRNMKEFYKIALSDLQKLINNLKNKNPKLRVIGFSGLCVSSEGINLFETKFNCKERDYKCPETIIEKDDFKMVVDFHLINKKQKEGWKLINRCKMLILYPKEKSVVWDYLK